MDTTEIHTAMQDTIDAGGVRCGPGRVHLTETRLPHRTRRLRRALRSSSSCGLGRRTTRRAPKVGVRVRELGSSETLSWRAGSDAPKRASIGSGASENET